MSPFGILQIRCNIRVKMRNERMWGFSTCGTKVLIPAHVLISIITFITTRFPSIKRRLIKFHSGDQNPIPQILEARNQETRRCVAIVERVIWATVRLLYYLPGWRYFEGWTSSTVDIWIRANSSAAEVCVCDDRMTIVSFNPLGARCIWVIPCGGKWFELMWSDFHGDEPEKS